MHENRRGRAAVLPRDSQQANGAEHGRVPLDVGRAHLADGRGDAWHLHRGVLTAFAAVRPHGAAYEPWTDLFYDFNDSNRPPPQHDGSGPASVKFRQGDEIAFVLDTNFGELEIYHSYYGLRRIMRGPEFRSNTLYAYCGLEKPGDVVEYIEIDNDTGAPLARTVPRGATSTNPYFEHALQASDEWHRRWNEPRP